MSDCQKVRETQNIKPVMVMDLAMSVEPPYSEVVSLAINLRIFVEFRFDGPPGGRCASISQLVTHVMNEHIATPHNRWKTINGYFNSPCAIPRRGWHCWSTDGHVLVDLTADQFGRFMPAVIVESANDYRYKDGSPYGERPDDPLIEQWRAFCHGREGPLIRWGR